MREFYLVKSIKCQTYALAFLNHILTIMALSTLKISMCLLSIRPVMYNTDTMITLKLQFLQSRLIARMLIESAYLQKIIKQKKKEERDYKPSDLNKGRMKTLRKR